MSRSDGDSADYYVLPEGATQLQDLISHRDMNSQIGEIFRACYRYGIVSHSDKMRDAKKIRFYAQAEVERLEKLSAAQNTGGSIPSNATYIVGEKDYECHKTIAEGWIQWEGGSCPVISSAYVDVLFRNANSPAKPVLASAVNWKHRAKPSRLDITAYRIARNAK